MHSGISCRELQPFLHNPPLLVEIFQQLQPQTLSSSNIPPIQCILVTLSFLATGNLQCVVAGVPGVSQLTAATASLAF